MDREAKEHGIVDRQHDVNGDEGVPNCYVARYVERHVDGRRVRHVGDGSTTSFRRAPSASVQSAMTRSVTSIGSQVRCTCRRAHRRRIAALPPFGSTEPEQHRVFGLGRGISGTSTMSIVLDCLLSRKVVLTIDIELGRLGEPIRA